ncbi:MAG: Gfo/Idh/MocA family protein [Bacteroidota bacterium]
MKEKKSSRRHQESRRDFVKKSALAATAMMAGWGPSAASSSPAKSASKIASSSILGANERLGVAFLGVGGQGFNSHLRNIVNLTNDGRPLHEYSYNTTPIAAADVFTKRRDQALAEMQRVNADAEVYDDYRRILDRNDVDAVFIGSVDHWHSRMAVDALDAGKHVYCEKPMTRYLGEGFDIYDKVKETGLVFQIGSQYCSEAKWHKAAELITAGKIGPLVMGQADYCRNNPDGEWNYTIEDETRPENLDWQAWLGPVSDRPFSADEYHRWRKYYPYCAGILGDLLAHQIHPLMIASGNPEFPTRVTCLGTREITPDRDVPDNTQLLANFPSGLTLLVIGSTVNEQGLGQVVRGHEGTIYLGGNSIELRPERPFADLVDREEYANLQPGPSIPYHIGDFFEGIRTGKVTNGNIDLAMKTQTVISLAEMSERLGEMVHFDAETRKVSVGSGREIGPITYGTLEIS